jgi:hypothetical protein
VLAPFAALGYLAYKVASLWAETDWSSLGSDIASGIVNGINSGAKWVIDTVKGLGRSAFGAFRSALGIASPSKEFAKLGKALPQGIAVGVRAGMPASDMAVERMVSIPDAPSGSEGSAESSRGVQGKAPASVNISVGDVHIHSKNEKPRELALDFKRELESILEGVAIRMGAPT